MWGARRERRLGRGWRGAGRTAQFWELKTGGDTVRMVTADRCEERHDRVVVRHDVVFRDAQIEIEHVQELALDPANVALAKDSCAHSPVHVLE